MAVIEGFEKYLQLAVAKRMEQRTLSRACLCSPSRKGP